MSVELCPQAVDCECDDFPLLNRTQDENDPPIFIGECAACGTLIGDDPPLGRVFQARGCQSWVTSTVSQAVANALAAAQEAACDEGGDDGGNPVPPVPWTPTPFTPLQQFGNEAVGTSCANGGNLIANVALPSNLSISGPTLTVAPASFTAPTQQQANALAASYVSDFMSDGLASGDLECEQFPRCGFPADVLGDFRPFIVDFDTLGIAHCAGPVSNAGGPAWDGYLRHNLLGNYCMWTASIAPGSMMTYEAADVRAFVVSCGGGVWALTIGAFDTAGGTIRPWWNGSCLTDDPLTPFGVYVAGDVALCNTGACTALPATIEVIAMQLP